jgi:hypothetical protein
LYLAEFSLEREMFQTKIVEKVKTHILFAVTFLFFFESRAFMRMWKNMGIARQAADDSITRRMRFAG